MHMCWLKTRPFLGCKKAHCCEDHFILFHKYLTTLWDYSFFTFSLLALYLGVLKVWMHCLFIGKHPAFVLQKTKGTNWCCKWH